MNELDDFTLSDEKLEEFVLLAMCRIPGKCKEPFERQKRKFPVDAVTIACIDWELIDPETRRDLRELRYYEDRTPDTGHAKRRNRIALALRRLAKNLRVEKLRSGNRRDMPRWRPLPVLDSLAKAAP